MTTRAELDNLLGAVGGNDRDNLEDGDATKGAIIHIRNQQRNGKKSYTIVTGVPNIFNYEKILKYLKKTLNCNGKGDG